MIGHKMQVFYYIVYTVPLKRTTDGGRAEGVRANPCNINRYDIMNNKEEHLLGFRFVRYSSFNI